MNNPQCEMNILAKLINDKDPEALANIDPIKFGNGDLQKLFIIVRNHYIDKDQWVGFDYLKQVVLSLCKTADKAEFMSGVIDQIKTRDIGDVKMSDLLEELDKFYKFRLITGKADKLISAVQGKDIEGALGEVRGMYEDIYVNTSKNLDENDALNLSGKKVKFAFRQTGLPELDERGPLIEGGFCCIAGSYGSGKSNLSLQIAVYHYLNYPESACYYSYELSSQEIYARILSNIAEVDVGNIMSDLMSEEEKIRYRCGEIKFHCLPDEKIEAFVKSTIDESDEAFKELFLNTFERRKNRFYIFDETCPFDELIVKMKLMRDTKNVKLQVVDYFTIVPLGRTNGLATWEARLLWSQRLKLFAKEDGKKSFIITPMQFKEKEEELRVSPQLANDTDLYIAITASDDDKILNSVTVKYKKFRTYLTVPGKLLKDFKLLKEFEYSRFRSLSF